MSKSVVRIYFANKTDYDLTKIEDWVFDDFGQFSEDWGVPNTIPAHTIGVWQSESEQFGPRGFVKFRVQDNEPSPGSFNRSRNNLIYVYWFCLERTEIVAKVEPTGPGELGPSPSGVGSWVPSYLVGVNKGIEHVDEGAFTLTEVAAGLTPTPLGAWVVGIERNLGAGLEYGYEGHLDLIPISEQIVGSSPQPAASWKLVCPANHVIAFASFGSDLVALTSDRVLWSRPSETPEIPWTHIGEAPGASQISVWRDRLLILTSSFQLLATRFGEEVDWQYIESAFPVEAPRRVTTIVKGSSTSRVSDTTRGIRVTPSSMIIGPRTNGTLTAGRIATFGELRLVEVESASAPLSSINGPAQTAGLPEVKWPEHALRLAILEDRMFVTSSLGVLWAANVGPGTLWRRLDSPGFPRALTQVNGRLLALNKAGEIYMRAASEDLVPWSMLNIEALPNATAIAAIAVSPHSFRVFATTRDNALWFSEVAPTIT